MDEEETEYFNSTYKKLRNFVFASGAIFLLATAGGLAFVKSHIPKPPAAQTEQAEEDAFEIPQEILDRRMLARLLHGEAGRGADPFEVLHTVLNRVAVRGKSIAEIVTEKDQYVGYDPEDPIIDRYYEIADMVMTEWEANGRTRIEGCNRFYFTSGSRLLPYNKFSTSADGSWYKKVETKEGTFCRRAVEQYNEFNSRK